jgi:hypothetical protein
MNRFTRTVVTAVVLGITFPASALFAQGTWELLGTRKVSFSRETDVIEVSRREGRFDAIRIEIDRGPLEMYDIRVGFANGESFSPATRINFGDGAQSRIIDLPGDSRTIDRIAFRYRGRARLGAAEVRVSGRRADRPDRDNRASRDPAADGWMHIGARQVDFRSEHDVVAAEGGRKFNTILIAVEGADVELYNVSVNFANGEHFDPETRLVFEENSRSRFIDLPGEARDIKNVEFRYRTIRRSGEGKAIVHVYGKTR